MNSCHFPCKGDSCPFGNPEKKDRGKKEIPTRRLLLVGNPNVGKSALFTRLTGVHALSSNYPGTTIGFMEGVLEKDGESFLLIDVPGAYTLEPTNEAEAIARRLVEEGADRVILVLDATALERNLVLGLEILERGLPVIVALNMVDEARHRGILIDIQALSEELGVPVVPTVAVTGEGIRELLNRLDEARPGKFSPMSKEERWETIGAITSRVQRVIHRHHTLRDRFEDVSVHPLWGGLLGFGVLLLTFSFIRFLGEGLINWLFDPFFEQFWHPLMEKTSLALGAHPVLHSILIGQLVNGRIDLQESFGVLTTGLYVEFDMVLPYIIAFYTVLSFLEDVGYLPRLAVLFDAFLHRLGLHGYAVIPTLLGFGCNVPGILATRVLESERERFIAATLISVGIPCGSLQAMIFGALGHYGMGYVLAVYGVLLASWVVIGRILHKFLPGYSPELIVEIPPYRWPLFKSLLFKVWFRIKEFLIEATPLVLGGIVLVDLLSAGGVIKGASILLAPLFKGVLGLPPQAAGPILMGFFRKDIAVGMLLPLHLTADQLLVAVVALSMTFPCIATFIILWKELGLKRLLESTAIMVLSSLAAGGVLHLILR